MTDQTPARASAASAASATAAEKRSVHTDALATLGTILDPALSARDAIHLAVEPAEAHERLHPGQHVGRTPAGKWMGARMGIRPLGIVDPFLPGDVARGGWFWLILYPRQISSLRHVWEHPDFPSPAAKEEAAAHKSHLDLLGPSIEAEAWIHAFAGRIEQGVSWENDDEPYMLSYADLMKGAGAWLERGEITYLGADIDYDDMAQSIPKFWEYYQQLTGTPVPEEKRESFFRCAC